MLLLTNKKYLIVEKTKKKTIELLLSHAEIKALIAGCVFNDEEGLITSKDGEQSVQLMIYYDRGDDWGVDLLDFSYPDFKSLNGLINPIKECVKHIIKMCDERRIKLSRVDFRFPSELYQWDQTPIFRIN